MMTQLAAVTSTYQRSRAYAAGVSFPELSLLRIQLRGRVRYRELLGSSGELLQASDHLHSRKQDEQRYLAEGSREGTPVEGVEDGQHDSGEPNGIVSSGQAPPNGTGKENKERMTTPYMTKYERARILGTRALQIR